MSNTDLLKPILSDNLRSINYFNGRVLTAEDMQVEQRVQRRRDELLGCAIGEGVAKGLEVHVAAGPDPAVTVAPGLALNRKGQTLLLEREVTIRIIPEDEHVEPGDALFVPCPEAAGTTAIPVGTGAYVLVASPAAEAKELAMRVGLADNGVAPTCESRYVVEGVQFRLLYLDLDNTTIMSAVLTDLADEIKALMALAAPSSAQESRLRNLLAHLCLGTVEATHFPEALFESINEGTTDVSYGPLDRMRDLDSSSQNRLTNCDVPLALLYWSKTYIDYIDMWSVRRRVHTLSQAARPPFPALDRRGAEAEAAFLQFQGHIAQIAGPSVTASQLDQIGADQYFRYLPAAGVIPEQAGTATGFGYLTFFQGLTFRDPVFVEGTKVQRLMRLSFAYNTIDLAERELIWLYRVRENRFLDTGVAPAPQAYLIFTSGHIPFMGDAQYDLARWDFANHGPIVAGTTL